MLIGGQGQDVQRAASQCAKARELRRQVGEQIGGEIDGQQFVQGRVAGVQVDAMLVGHGIGASWRGSHGLRDVGNLHQHGVSPMAALLRSACIAVQY